MKVVILLIAIFLLASCNLSGNAKSKTRVSKAAQYVPTNSDNSEVSHAIDQPIDFKFPSGWFLPLLTPPQGSRSCAIQFGRYKPTKSIYGYIDGNFGVCSFSNDLGWNRNKEFFDDLLITKNNFSLNYDRGPYESYGMTVYVSSYSSKSGDHVLLTFVVGVAYGYDYTNSRYDKSLSSTSYSLEISKD